MVDYLDPEIANEGLAVGADWAPAVDEARIPTYKGIKSIQKYFPQFTGRPYVHQAFPCWLYHPKLGAREIRDHLTADDPPRVIKKASEIAKELGCVYRPTTMEERGQGFPLHRWEYSGEWRATPFKTGFDPKKPETGKILVHEKSGDGPQIPNTELIAATVAAILAKTGEARAPVDLDPDYLEFQAFKAWKESKQVQSGDLPENWHPPLDADIDHGKIGTNALSGGDDREALEELARTKGIKVDGRWSIDRLKTEIDKAL